jgi:hypothetical protein
VILFCKIIAKLTNIKRICRAASLLAITDFLLQVKTIPKEVDRFTMLLTIAESINRPQSSFQTSNHNAAEAPFAPRGRGWSDTQKEGLIQGASSSSYSVCMRGNFLFECIGVSNLSLRLLSQLRLVLAVTSILADFRR